MRTHRIGARKAIAGISRATVADPVRPARHPRFLCPRRRGRPRPGPQPEIRPQARLRRRSHQLVRRPPELACLGRCILVGDLNIAPLEHDVWSHKQLLTVVSHTPIEVEHLNAWRDTAFADAVRHFVPEDQKLYTWWSYRNQDWRRSNRGRRLDHIWVTPDLVPRLLKHDILIDARDWVRTSDHVPVAVELDV